ncbi:putative pre-mRNA branch site protein p14 [Nadsonia fulvescens var. elongata DSM 6958]|uniref:Putative pre-mRNA branch site protein p14 n=1 Tax=Nadsonia fulvescens var. elongata DSM 6958 TaxID=857566 RepID=A0A1E3PK57_9ASCO|nr:putative pre-mRNA branch site protein p14 [Nadsonia fulvescens var. elongata DSM 6958]
MSRRPPQFENQIVYIKNLSYDVTSSELYSLFGKFGGIRQIRLGNIPETKGTAYVVYHELQDAKMACEKLSGFNFKNRYLVTMFHSSDKMNALKMQDIETRKANLESLKRSHGIE